MSLQFLSWLSSVSNSLAFFSLGLVRVVSHGGLSKILPNNCFLSFVWDLSCFVLIVWQVKMLFLFVRLRRNMLFSELFFAWCPIIPLTLDMCTFTSYHSKMPVWFWLLVELFPMDLLGPGWLVVLETVVEVVSLCFTCPNPSLCHRF